MSVKKRSPGLKVSNDTLIGATSMNSALFGVARTTACPLSERSRSCTLGLSHGVQPNVLRWNWNEFSYACAA